MTAGGTGVADGPPALGADGRVVVVGGGVGGLSAAVELRRLGHAGPVVVLDAAPLLHDRPPLSKAYLRAEVAESDLSPYPAERLADLAVDVRTSALVVGLGPGGPGAPAVLRLGDGTLLEADAVVLAEGGRASRLPVSGVGLALVLRTLDDARALRARLVPGARLVVLGGGLVGAEVAATAVTLGVRVTVVDPDPLPVAAAVGPVVARVLVEDHARHGVRVLTAGAAGLAQVDGDLRVNLSDGTSVEADVVLVATGMRPVDDLARGAGIEVAPDGGTLVDERQRTSAPRVLAVGDGTCRRRGDGTPGRPAGHWDAARLDGLAAAATLVGRPVPDRGAAWFWSDRHGRHVEVVGALAEAGTQAGTETVTGSETGAGAGAGGRTVVRGEPGPGPFSALAWRDGVLTGAVAVDDALAARAARRLVDRAVPVDPDVVADPATDLRRLARG